MVPLQDKQEFEPATIAAAETAAALAAALAVGPVGPAAGVEVVGSRLETLIVPLEAEDAWGAVVRVVAVLLVAGEWGAAAWPRAAAVEAVVAAAALALPWAAMKAPRTSPTPM